MIPSTERTTCSRCGHAAAAHGANGCAGWSPGTAAQAPHACACELDAERVRAKLGTLRRLQVVE